MTADARGSRSGRPAGMPRGPQRLTDPAGLWPIALSGGPAPARHRPAALELGRWLRSPASGPRLPVRAIAREGLMKRGLPGNLQFPKGFELAHGLISSKVINSLN